MEITAAATTWRVFPRLPSSPTTATTWRANHHRRRRRGRRPLGSKVSEEYPNLLLSRPFSNNFTTTIFFRYFSCIRKWLRQQLLPKAPTQVPHFVNIYLKSTPTHTHIQNTLTHAYIHTHTHVYIIYEISCSRSFCLYRKVFNMFFFCFMTVYSCFLAVLNKANRTKYKTKIKKTRNAKKKS